MDGSEQGPVQAMTSVSPEITDPTPPAEDNTMVADELHTAQDDETPQTEDSQIGTYRPSGRPSLFRHATSYLASPVFKAMLTWGVERRGEY